MTTHGAPAPYAVDMPDDSGDGQGRQCRACEIVWAVAGLAAGAALVFIGLDLATGGRLTGARNPDEEGAAPDE